MRKSDKKDHSVQRDSLQQKLTELQEELNKAISEKKATQQKETPILRYSKIPTTETNTNTRGNESDSAEKQGRKAFDICSLRRRVTYVFGSLT